MSEYIRTYIYLLTDPRDMTIRYVGRTCNPKHRLVNHYGKKATQGTTPYNDWIRDMTATNVKPEMHVVQECPSAGEGRKAEASLVRELLQYNAPLVNKSRFLYTPYGNFKTAANTCAMLKCKQTDSHTHRGRRATHGDTERTAA